jgi:hypothetical protein
MTTLSFSDCQCLTTELAFKTIEALEGADWAGATVRARYGASEQSCSTYVQVSFLTSDDEYMEDVDGDSEIKIRFSDHANRHGADVSFEINSFVEDITDECGEHGHTEISEDSFKDLVASACAAAVRFFETLKRVEDDE